MDFFSKKYLPDELWRIIFEYLPNECKIKLNKQYYKKYHYLIRNIIINRQTENYIRDMIKKDCDFVLMQLLLENNDRWKKMSPYFDSKTNTEYENYLHFLIHYSINLNSNKCLKIICKNKNE